MGIVPFFKSIKMSCENEFLPFINKVMSNVVKGSDEYETMRKNFVERIDNKKYFIIFLYLLKETDIH